MDFFVIHGMKGPETKPVVQERRYGLFMDGAGNAQARAIDESLPKWLYDTMKNPQIDLCARGMPTLEVDGRRRGRYECPVYKTRSRAPLARRGTARTS